MHVIHVVARHVIKPGKLDEFKRVGEVALAIARDKEPDTQQYDWFFDAEHATCTVLHRYKNFAALRQHIQNFLEIHDELVTLCDTSLEVYGSLSADEAASLDVYGVKVFTRFQGFLR